MTWSGASAPLGRARHEGTSRPAERSVDVWHRHPARRGNLRFSFACWPRLKLPCCGSHAAGRDAGRHRICDSLVCRFMCYNPRPALRRGATGAATCWCATARFQSAPRVVTRGDCGRANQHGHNNLLHHFRQPGNCRRSGSLPQNGKKARKRSAACVLQQIARVRLGTRQF